MKTVTQKLCHPLLAVAVSSVASVALAGTYPDFPEPFADGGGALIDTTAYVGLGSAKAHFYALNLNTPEKGWETLPDFPGGDRGQPVVASVAGKLYVFGGLQKNTDGVLQILSDVHAYDPTDKTWNKITTRSPFSVVGASAFVHDNKIYFVGGVNLSIFNGYFQDYTAAGDNKAQKEAIMATYFDMPAEDYFFNRQLFSYEPATNKWHNEGIMPFAGRAGASVTWLENKLMVANGEIKPGLRTADVEYAEFKNGKATWQQLPKLIPNEGNQVQEGIAGAYSGMSNNHYLITGGANFVGATKQYADGDYFAHRGLSKAYHDTVFTLKDGAWEIAGKIPVALGYGVTLNYDNKMLVVGGKNNDGAVKSIYTLSYDGNELTIE